LLRSPKRVFRAKAFSLYPGEAEAGAAVLEACDRAMIFGGTATVDRYRGKPKGTSSRTGLLQKSC